MILSESSSKIRPPKVRHFVLRKSRWRRFAEGVVRQNSVGVDRDVAVLLMDSGGRVGVGSVHLSTSRLTWPHISLNACVDDKTRYPARGAQVTKGARWAGKTGQGAYAARRS
jgi:hypothetical protein